MTEPRDPQPLSAEVAPVRAALMAAWQAGRENRSLDASSLVVDALDAARSTDGHCPDCGHEWRDHGPRGCEVRYGTLGPDGMCVCTEPERAARSTDGLRAALDEPWLDDIIRSLAFGLNTWQDAHRVPGKRGVWQFLGADGAFHELVQSTLRRLKDYRAALASPEPAPLDVERLARAVMTTDAVPMPRGWVGYRNWAKRIAAAYAEGAKE